MWISHPAHFTRPGEGEGLYARPVTSRAGNPARFTALWTQIAGSRQLPNRGVRTDGLSPPADEMTMAYREEGVNPQPQGSGFVCFKPVKCARFPLSRRAFLIGF